MGKLIPLLVAKPLDQILQEPFIAPLLLAIGGFTAFYLTLALLSLAGAVAVLRLPEVGREGDPRWAQITRTPAATAAAVHLEEIS